MVFFKILGFVLLGILGLIVFFLLFVLLGTLIPVNRKSRQSNNGVAVYLKSDGIHADFILPTINHLYDWSKIITSGDYQTPLSQQSFLGIGWGDRGFYLDIPTWGDLTPKIVCKALCIPSPTVVHVISYAQPPNSFKYFRKLILSEAQYLALCEYIQSYFRTDEGAQVQLVPDVGYTPDDNFYLAERPYHVFHTCNYWVNRGLKRIGIRTSLWSPSPHGIFLHLKKF
ncbi:MAG: TIGR02117 family protein [Bacteroidota bacterium]